MIGIAEAAFHAATLVATGFSVVTTLARTCVIAEHLVLHHGFERRCHAFDRILACARDALARDRSGAIVLGCAGMVDLCHALQRRLGVPVIDGVGAAVKLAEAGGAGFVNEQAGRLRSADLEELSGAGRAVLAALNERLQRAQSSNGTSPSFRLPRALA